MKKLMFFLLVSIVFFSCKKDNFESDDIANNQLELSFEFNGESISICQDAPWTFYNGPCEMESNFFAYHSQLETADLDLSVLIEKVNYKKAGFIVGFPLPELRILLNTEGKGLKGKHPLEDSGVNYIEIQDEAGVTFHSIDGEIQISHVSKKTFIGGPGREKREYRYVEGNFKATLQNDNLTYPIKGQFILAQFVGEI